MKNGNENGNLNGTVGLLFLGLIIGLCVSFFFLGFNKGQKETMINLIGSDTTKVVDTVWVQKTIHDTVVFTAPSSRVIVNKEVFKRDTITRFDTISVYQLDSFRVYSYIYTNDTIELNSRVSVLGILDSHQLSYSLKYNIPHITETVTIHTRELIDNTPVVNIMASGGFQMSGMSVSPTVGLNLVSKRFFWGYDYGPFNNSHSVRLGISLYKFKKGGR
jgi:hypothetical protein